MAVDAGVPLRPSTQLRRVDPAGPGITRRRAGRGFIYRDSSGARVHDEGTLARIRNLVIPPAWEDVWISPNPRGHIQVRGIDQRGRLQYVYHEAWHRRRDRQKFDRMVAFAQALPALRERVAHALSGSEAMSRERVLACAIRLLELGFFRIGSEGYAEENHTYGLATMLKDHVMLCAGTTLVFDYIAKSGRRRIQSVVDSDIFAVVQRLKRRRGGGPRLLAYREAGTWIDLHAADINGEIKAWTGGDFTAKDFRTWEATLLAAIALAVSDHVSTASARRRAVSRAMKEVAHYLGNTPAVARSSYVDPRLIDHYLAGETVATALASAPAPASSEPTLAHADLEAAVIDLLTGGASSGPS